MADRDLDVLVVGAGIGGLTTALSLHAAGFRSVRVLEAVPVIRPLGVGLNILPNAIRELTELGLFDRLAARAVPTAEFVLYHRSGGRIWREPRGVAAGFRWPQLSIHRGHLQTVLADAVRERLGAAALRTDAKVLGVDGVDGDRVRVTLGSSRTTDTTTVSADVVVGADGLHSAVRAVFYPDEGEPRTNGMVMWRGTTWAEPYLTGRSMIVVGDDQRKVVVYPIVPAERPGGPVLLNWVTGMPGHVLPEGGTTESERRAAVLRQFGDWSFPWLDIPEMMRATEGVLEYPMQDRDPLPRWAFGRVVLLGDAAHPMYPVGSNGATQSVVDGRALAYHLATVADPVEALAAFEADRRPRLTKVQQANRRMGPERAIDLVHQRAPEGFAEVREVMSEDELAAISRDYSAVGGFVPDELNAQPHSPYLVPAG